MFDFQIAGNLTHRLRVHSFRITLKSNSVATQKLWTLSIEAKLSSGFSLTSGISASVTFRFPHLDAELRVGDYLQGCEEGHRLAVGVPVWRCFPRRVRTGDGASLQGLDLHGQVDLDGFDAR